MRLSHGLQLAGIRHFLLPAFAQRFHEAGLNVLLYDNRCWGDSDGEPRQESNPAKQHADYYDAFNFAQTLENVDGTQIVYWGTSFSGQNVILAAATDKRIKAAIVQCSAISGHHSPQALKDFIPGVLNNRAQNVEAPAARIPLIAADRESAKTGTALALFNDIYNYDSYIESSTCGGKWENWITEQTLLHIVEMDADAMIHRVAPTPLFMAYASRR